MSVMYIITHMPRKRRVGYTSIGIPIYLKERLKEYGEFGESWTDLLLRMMKVIDEAKLLKARYRLK